MIKLLSCLSLDIQSEGYSKASNKLVIKVLML